MESPSQKERERGKQGKRLKGRRTKERGRGGGWEGRGGGWEGRGRGNCWWGKNSLFLLLPLASLTTTGNIPEFMVPFAPCSSSYNPFLLPPPTLPLLPPFSLLPPTPSLLLLLLVLHCVPQVFGFCRIPVMWNGSAWTDSTTTTRPFINNKFLPWGREGGEEREGEGEGGR